MSRLNFTSRWPFWLLLAAWFCANTPQVITPHLLVWVKSSAHFSHQARLTRDVALMLTGQNHSARHLEVSPPTEPNPPLPAIPLDALDKKFSLAAVATEDAVHPRAPHTAIRRVNTSITLPGSPVDDVPHPPPRTRSSV
jgi:hypothetical protein